MSRCSNLNRTENFYKLKNLSKGFCLSGCGSASFLKTLLQLENYCFENSFFLSFFFPNYIIITKVALIYNIYTTVTLRKFVFVFVFWPKLISRSAWPFLRQTCTFNELFLRSSILMIWTNVLFSSIWSKTYFDSFWCVYLDSYSFHSLEKNALVLVVSIAAKDFPGDFTVYLTTLAFFLILKEAFSVHDLGQIFTTFTVFFVVVVVLFCFFFFANYML